MMRQLSQHDVVNELLIFAKAPRPGFVKTRLAETLGKGQACQVYQQLLRTISSSLATIPRVTVCYSPADAPDELRSYFPSHWRFRPQRGSDLGARLHDAIATSFTSGANKAAVIGSDCPYITPDDISQTWLALDHHDLVFGPALDGGYWLIGANRPHPDLFNNVDWGTSTVLNQSLACAQKLNLKVALLRKLSDIDTEADWRAFTSNSTPDFH
jgi:rSAM/selenodomain-associated transferase 1